MHGPRRRSSQVRVTLPLEPAPGISIARIFDQRTIGQQGRVARLGDQPVIPTGLHHLRAERVLAGRGRASQHAPRRPVPSRFAPRSTRLRAAAQCPPGAPARRRGLANDTHRMDGMRRGGGVPQAPAWRVVVACHTLAAARAQVARRGGSNTRSTAAATATGSRRPKRR